MHPFDTENIWKEYPEQWVKWNKSYTSENTLIIIVSK